MVEEQMVCPLTKGERILVAIDGSEYSEEVVKQAISMGKICNSLVFVLSVIELYPEHLEHAPALEEKLSKEARETLEKAKSRLEEENIPCETIVRIDGQPHNVIVSEAKEKNIDLIIMGAHGRGRLMNVIMGSVTQKVIGNAPCPVMVIPV